MTTFTVWKYDDPATAEQAATILKKAAREGLVKVEDHAVLTWEQGSSRPKLEHGREGERSGTGWGAFWGLLVGG